MASFNKVHVKKLYIPNSHGTKKSFGKTMGQVTATASELNVLDGITATVAELNRTDYSAELASRLQTAEHGAGAIGTAFAPRTYRWTDLMGVITTEIHLDLTGLKAKGDAANDVIGLGVGGAAYLGQYTTATWGVLYKAEVECLEVPAGTSVTTDIDFAFNTSGSLIYDGAAGAAELNLGGVAVGASYTDRSLSLTTTDYLYIVEGDTAAIAGTFTAGQLIIRFYGHTLLT